MLPAPFDVGKVRLMLFSNRTGPFIPGRQVTLRRLTAFPFIASRQENDGGLHPPNPQPPSLPRADRSFESENRITRSEGHLKEIPPVHDLLRPAVVIPIRLPDPAVFAAGRQRDIRILEGERHIVRRIIHAPVLRIAETAPEHDFVRRAASSGLLHFTTSLSLA